MATADDLPHVHGRRSTPLRDNRRLLVLIVLLHGFLFLWTASMFPAFQAPDEAAHVDLVVAHRHGDLLLAPGERQIQAGIAGALAQSPPTGAQMHLGDSPPMLRTDRKSFDALGTGPVSPPGVPNQLVQHPPLYYELAAGYSYLVPHFSHQRFDVQIFWLRMLSVLLLLPVPVLLFATGLRLTGSRSMSVTTTLLPLLIPSYLRAGASVTNDALLIVLGALLMWLLATVVTGDHSRRTAVFVGVTWGLMLLTKGTALILPPAIAASYVIGAVGTLRGRFLRALRPLALAAVVGSAVGAWWWIRNLVLYGQVQPSGYGPGWSMARLYQYTGPPPHVTRSQFVHKFLGLLGQRVFGSLGLIDQPTLSVAFLRTLTVILLVLVAWGTVRGFPQARCPRWAAVALLSPTLLCLVSITLAAHTAWVQVHLLPGIQVRYFVPFMAPVMVAASLALDQAARALRAWVPLTVLGLVVALEAADVLLLLRVQYGASHGGLSHQLSTGLRFVVGWAPWPPFVTLSTGALVALLAGVLAMEVVRLRKEPPPSALGLTT